MNTRTMRFRRNAFTMIEVLTVGAIAALILAISLPAYNWMSQSREREAAAEAITAQIMSARAHAVQFRTYAGVSIHQINNNNACRQQSTGQIHQIRVNPVDVANPVNNKYFYHLPGRAPVGIPKGVGFARGNKPDAGSTAAELSNSSRFYIVFGPDGILRNGWEVRRVYRYTGSNLWDVTIAHDNETTLPLYRFSTNSFGVYDDTRVNDITSSNPAVKLKLIYGLNGDPADADPGLNALVQNNLLVQRYFINPATGLAIANHEFEP